jgi:hypothetical protein
MPLTVWDEESSQGYPLILDDNDLIHISPHNGDWAVWLGGDDEEIASISQLVTIPNDNSNLVYWYWIHSNGTIFPCDSDYEGTAGVKIDGKSIGEEHRLCGDQDTGWLQNSISLNDYMGQTVVLEVWVETPLNPNHGGPSIYIDDVSIELP